MALKSETVETVMRRNLGSLVTTLLRQGVPTGKRGAIPNSKNYWSVHGNSTRLQPGGLKTPIFHFYNRFNGLPFETWVSSNYQSLSLFKRT